MTDELKAVESVQTPLIAALKSEVERWESQGKVLGARIVEQAARIRELEKNNSDLEKGIFKPLEGSLAEALSAHGYDDMSVQAQSLEMRIDELTEQLAAARAAWAYNEKGWQDGNAMHQLEMTEVRQLLSDSLSVRMAQEQQWARDFPYRYTAAHVYEAFRQKRDDGHLNHCCEHQFAVAVEEAKALLAELQKDGE